MSTYFAVVHCEKKFNGACALVNRSTKTRLNDETYHGAGDAFSFESLDQALFLKALAQHLTNGVGKKGFGFKKNEKKALEDAHEDLLSTPGILVKFNKKTSPIRRENIISFEKIRGEPYAIDKAESISDNFEYQRDEASEREVFFIVNCESAEPSFYASDREGKWQLCTKFIDEAVGRPLCSEHVDKNQFIERMAEHLTGVSERTIIRVAFSEKEALVLANSHSHYFPCFIVKAIVPSSAIFPERSENDHFRGRLLGNVNCPYPELGKKTKITSSNIIGIRAMKASEYRNSMKGGREYIESLSDNFHIEASGYTPNVGEFVAPIHSSTASPTF